MQNWPSMKAEKSIHAQIVELVKVEGLPPGSHLPAQMLADRLRVSRSPVNDALSLLQRQGLALPSSAVAPAAPEALPGQAAGPGQSR